MELAALPADSAASGWATAGQWAHALLRDGSRRMRVRFQCHAEPGLSLELAGDFPNFARPRPMQEVSAGVYRCELELGPGVYRYKFCSERKNWWRDPAALVIDHAEGVDNSVVVVGGLSQ